MCSFFLNWSDQSWSSGCVPEVPGPEIPSLCHWMSSPGAFMQLRVGLLEEPIITITLVYVVSSPKGPPRQ